MKLKVTELTLEDFVKDAKKEFYGKSLKGELEDTINSFNKIKDKRYSELEEVNKKIKDEIERIETFKSKKEQVDDDIFNEVLENLEERLNNLKKQKGRIEYFINNHLARIKDLEERLKNVEKLKEIIELVDFI